MKDEGYTPIAQMIVNSFNNSRSCDNESKEVILKDLLNYTRTLSEFEELVLFMAEDSKGEGIIFFIDNYISSSPSIVNLLDKKEIQHIKYISDNFEYPKAISLLVKRRLLNEERLHNSPVPILRTRYRESLTHIDARIHRLATYQKEQIQAKIYNRQGERPDFKTHQTLDIIDAIGAFMVYDEEKAFNILSHTGVAYDDSTMYRMEVMLNDYYLYINNKYYIPRVYFRGSDIKIDLITSDLITRNLKSMQFVQSEINLSSHLDSKSLVNIKLFEDKLYLLFNHFNPSLTHKHIRIFISTLQKNNTDNHNYGEAVYVRALLTETIKANKDLNRKFVLLLYFLKYEKNFDSDIFCIASVGKFIEVISDYFPESAELGFDTVKSYLSRKTSIRKNFKDFGQEIGRICRFPPEFIEKYRVNLESVI